VKPVGVYLSASGLLGASPDGLVSDDHIVEVKCPCTLRSGLSIMEAAKYKRDFYLSLTDSCDMVLSSNHSYYHQFQGALHITGANVTCLFGHQLTQKLLEFQDIQLGLLI